MGKIGKGGGEGREGGVGEVGRGAGDESHKAMVLFDYLRQNC